MELDGLSSTVVPPHAVTLTFDLKIRTPNRYVSMPDLILVKLAPTVVKIFH